MSGGKVRIPGVIWSFGPWIAYWVLAGTGRPRAAILAALGCSLTLNVHRFLRRRVKTMDLFTLLFHGLNAVLILGFDLRFMVYYGGMPVDLALALYAWATLVIGRPFTLEFAREDWDRAFWQDPIFLRTNAIITGVWATVFTLQAACAGSSLVMGLEGTKRLVAVAVVPRLLLIGAICFTAWFPRWYPPRAAAARALRATRRCSFRLVRAVAGESDAARIQSRRRPGADGNHPIPPERSRRGRGIPRN